MMPIDSRVKMSINLRGFIRINNKRLDFFTNKILVNQI